MRFFETVGNAILIAYDDKPILTTDPWINEGAYFGSWTHDYEIAPDQLAAVRDADYHWFSHGHPDHLNIASLPMLTKGEFLLPDHYGSRIQRDLAAAGHRARILPDQEWLQLSKGIRICSIANRNQDAMLLIDINGRLVINMNDSSDYGESFRVRRLARISHRGRCIGAPFLRKSCWLNDLSQGQGESRCRQSVAQRYSNLHPSKGAWWWP